MIKFLPAIAITIVFSLVSCKSNSARNIVQNVKTMANEKKNEIAIAGSWVSKCTQESIIPKFRSGLEVYNFKINGNFERRHYFFSDTNCKSPSAIRVEHGEIAFPNMKNVKNASGAPVDFAFHKVELETRSKTVTDVLNAIHYCDTHFVPGQKRNLSGVSQLGPTCAGIKHVPRKTFGSIKLDNGKLVVAEDSVESVNNRSAVGDRATVFTKGNFVSD